MLAAKMSVELAPKNTHRWLFLICIGLVSGCAHFQPQPLAPEKSAAQLESRRLDDDGLKKFLEKNLGHELQNRPLLVLANLPFALVGGVLAIFLVGIFSEEGRGSLSLGTLVGFVTLFGITMRNSIMMISHFEHLVNEEGMTWGLETALRGSTERLVPILMTALVTGLGLLPLALGSGEAGREIEGPMAIVILGGLVTSTLLNLLVLPTLALRFGKFDKIKAQP
jgi:hypothetical protein